MQYLPGLAEHLAVRCLSRPCPQIANIKIEDLNLMDVAQLIERFAIIHRRPPKSKYELESWFEEYASSAEGRLLIERAVSDNQDPKRLRTKVVRQIQRLYREVHGHDGSLMQIEKWMRSLEGRAILDASRGRDGRIGFDSDRP